MRLPDLPAGIYRHYKGHLFLVLGYGLDSNDDDRLIIIYVGLELEGARPGPRWRARTASDFMALVDPSTGEAVDRLRPPPGYVRRFTYLGAGWEPGR